MKKPLFLMLSIVGFSGILAANTIHLTLVPLPQAVTAGQAVNLDVDISGLGNPPSVGAFDLSVSFDPTLLAPAATPVTFGAAGRPRRGGSPDCVHTTLRSGRVRRSLTARFVRPGHLAGRSGREFHSCHALVHGPQLRNSLLLFIRWGRRRCLREQTDHNPRAGYDGPARDGFARDNRLGRKQAP